MSNRLFSGREAKYNRIILKVLFEKGCLSAYNIAKQIFLEDPERKPKENLHHKAQKINSVLVRKNGRLSKLEQQEFIKKTENGYCLTIFKGLCSALSLFKTVKKPGFDDHLSDYIIFPELKKIIEIASKTSPEAILEDYEILRKVAIDLLEKGLNFELISNDQFNAFVNQRYQEIIFQEYKTNNKKGNESWKKNPELQDAVFKFIDRLFKMALKKLEEVRVLKEKILDDSKKEEIKPE